MPSLKVKGFDYRTVIRNRDRLALSSGSIELVIRIPRGINPVQKKYVSRRPSAARIQRREVLGFMGGAAIVSLAGCLRKPFASAELTTSAPISTETTTAERPACIVRPQQTEGPYFVEAGLNRSDIRSDPASGAVKEGIPLRLAFQVSEVSAIACVPLEGAIVDIWHCDALGVYSDVVDRRFNTLGQKFLRGSQVTSANGTVEFLTIYPGWYAGRTVHIHFKIRTHGASPQGYEFTSQLYFEDDVTDQIQAQPPYNTRERRTIQNNRDGIFRNGGEQLTLQLTEETESYRGVFNIGLELT